MEYLKTYYSLEKHLEETIKYNPQFEILNAIWKLNKGNLSSALSNINQYFPHYSLHERSHSDKIISNIESFLGEERIKNLSPTDTWLLLMAAFTHDLGMVVFHELVEKEWSSKNFQKFLEEVSDWDDSDMSASGSLLLKLQKLSDNQKIEDSEWIKSLTAIEVKRAVTLIVGEYMRRIHHKRSSDILNGIDKVFSQVANSFYSDQIPGRLLTILADVAYLHGVEFYEIFKKLDFEANGISNDKIHPRFIAAMLRLGDLLDIDDSRFNTFTEKVFKFPEESTFHKKKHSSVKHFLVTPEAIEITADCPDESVYRLARNWYDWLEGEVENQSREWSNIAPKNLNGSAPRVPKGKIKVFFNGARADDSLINLKFQISSEKVFDILEGAAIYENAEFTFIREVVQNALDASKIQLWKEIEKGTYDFVFKEHFSNSDLTHDEIIRRINFPNDIPQYLLNGYQISLSFEWKDKNEDELLIIVKDQGTGISNADLIRMTSKVGESRKNDFDYQELLKRIPFWLKPTGAFGVGLQSIFLVVDHFVVQSKSEGEDSKEVVFRSAKKGKYSFITDNQPEIQRGTKVIISVPKKNFKNIFGASISWHSAQTYDFFTDVHDSPHVASLKYYVTNTLKNVDILSISFFDEKYRPTAIATTETKELGEEISADKKVHMSVSHNNNNLVFNFYENVIGSQFQLIFDSNITEFELGRRFNYGNKLYVRDIPVGDNPYIIYEIPYPKFSWNLMSDSSDKILNISRDKLIHKRFSTIRSSFIENVLPTSINLIEDFINNNQLLIKELFKGNDEGLALSYYKILLTKFSTNLGPVVINKHFLKSVIIPIEVVSYLNDSPVKMFDFFELESLVVINQNDDYRRTDLIRDNVQLKSVIGKYFDKTPVIWDSQYFSSYLESVYEVTEAIFLEEKQILYLNRKSSSTGKVKVIQGYDIYLNKLVYNKYYNNRAFVYPIDKYADKLAIKNRYITGYESFPYLTSFSIVSPFNNISSYNELKKSIESSLNSKKDIKMHLSDELIKKYITPTLIKWIIDNHMHSENSLKQEEIISGYRELIADLLISKS